MEKKTRLNEIKNETFANAYKLFCLNVKITSKFRLKVACILLVFKKKKLLIQLKVDVF